MATPNLLLMAGAALFLGDYYDRKYQISRDLSLIYRHSLWRNRIERIGLRDYSYADFWEESCDRFDLKVALTYEGKSYTFLDIDQAANRLAHVFLMNDISRGDVVAIYMHSRPELVFCFLALVKIGAIPAFINDQLKGKSLQHILQASKATNMIFGREMAHIVESVKETYKFRVLLCYGEPVRWLPFAFAVEEMLSSVPSTRPEKKMREGINIDSMFALMYSSGTTGFPKASIIKHYRALASAAVFASVHNIKSSDRMYTPLPLYHPAGSLIGFGTVIFTGASMVLSEFSSSAFWTDVINQKCTVIQYIGEQCRYLLANPPSEIDTQHKVRLAMGNGLRPEIWERFQTRFNVTEICEFYASSEGNVTLTHRVTKGGAGVGAVGHLGPFSSWLYPVKIVAYDHSTQAPYRNAKGFCVECRPGQVGELIGPMTGARWFEFAGYLDNETDTQAKLIHDVFKKGDTYYRTGDLLKRDQRGFFYFVDRIGDTYRWKGYNVSTSQVESIIVMYPGVREANVYGVKIPGTDGRAGMAALVLESGAFEVFDFIQFAKYLLKELPDHAVPLFLRILLHMEITPTFKHTKVHLRNEGMNPSIINDPLYFLDLHRIEYHKFTESKYSLVISGRARL